MVIMNILEIFLGKCDNFVCRDRIKAVLLNFQWVEIYFIKKVVWIIIKIFRITELFGKDYLDKVTQILAITPTDKIVITKNLFE